jgi:hypothetical protein
MKSHLIITSRTCAKCKECTGYDPVDSHGKSVSDHLRSACVLAGIPKVEDLEAPSLIHLLAREFKVKCTDCGYYPYERGGTVKRNYKLATDPEEGLAIHELTPEVEKHFERLKDRLCGRCGKGYDTNGDGDCAICGNLTDLEVAERFRGRDNQWAYFVEELLGGQGVRVSQRLIGPVQAPCPPDVNYMNGNSVQNHVKKLAGRVLTLIEAAITGTQGEAVKTLIRREFRAELSKIGDFFYGPCQAQTAEVEVTQEL